MLKRKTLNLLCSGPSGGKTTLILQAIKAHHQNEPFFIPELWLPEGNVCIVTTDRTEETLRDDLLVPLGIDPERLLIISFLTEYSTLSNLPEKQLRLAISQRMKGRNIGTLILDLYEDFQSDNAASLKARGRDARDNAHWAQEENVAILGVTYPFKQKTNAKAVRVQDQISGSLGGQASAHTKLMLNGPEDNGSFDKEEGPHWDLVAKLGPGQGVGGTYRLTRESITPIGLFSRVENSQDILTGEALEIYVEFGGNIPKGTPLDRQTIEELTGLTSSSCYRKLNSMIEAGYVKRAKHGTYIFSEIK